MGYPQGKENWPPRDPKNPPRGVDIANIARTNRTHRKGNMWLTVTNWGFLGNFNKGNSEAFDDPEYPGLWAPQCEYPGNSDVQYLYQGGLWVGALVEDAGFEFPRVSIGTAGWVEGHEFQPGEVGGLPIEEHGILERSTIPNSFNRLGEAVYSSDAIGEQDFIAVYTDTLTESFWIMDDIIDGPHFPLGIRVEQRSYSWSYNYAQEFILIDYTIENIASNFLKNFYIGFYIDSDVGFEDESNRKLDDICGFQRWYYYDRIQPDGSTNPDSLIINTAWIADNDGRPYQAEAGTELVCPAVTGVRVVRAPNPRLRTSFNWWIRSDDPAADYGPAWVDDGEEWTSIWGTPVGDARKYFVLSNGEFDFDQVYVNDTEWIQANPQVIRDPQNPEIVLETHNWKIEPNPDYANDIANGYDTRYMISWGPLGIYDHTDPSGNDIYRLNPGEKFHMTVAYVAGAAFHDEDRPQNDPSDIDPNLFNFANLRYNAAWAAKVYDNEMIDTNGDGWFGEDVGTDGLFAQEVGDSVIYFGVYQGFTYPGPDEDGSERNGRLDEGEDEIWRPEYVYDSRYGELNIGYTRFNNALDPGDGIPDFKGPPPPPIPKLTYELTDNDVILIWENNAQDPAYFDPFSGMQDFEGYRVYVSDTGLENDYNILAEYDVVDFAYYSLTDSLATIPDNRTNAPADTVIDSVPLIRQPVGQNTGLEAIVLTSEAYACTIKYAHPCFPRYYSVCSFDYGDPRSGTEPLETARNANAVYAAPAGNPANKVTVVPNPYRAYKDYTKSYMGGLSWENQDDGTPEWFPQTDRRIEFINLPAECLIRIYTLGGDLVQIIPHSSATINPIGDTNLQWTSINSEGWDLNTRNGQQVVSGLYLFSVEDLTPGKRGNVSVGKFVVIR